MEKKYRRKGDLPLVAATLFTLLFAVAVIIGVRTDAPVAGSFESFDVERVIEMIDRGSLSDREAEHWEVMP